MTFHLSIATPITVTYNDEVYSIIIPGSLGYMEILFNHADLITSLRPGNVTLMTKNREKRTYKISGGFFEISKNQATLLANTID